MNSNPQKDEPPTWQHLTVTWPFLSSARPFRAPGPNPLFGASKQVGRKTGGCYLSSFESSISDYRRVFLLSFVVGRPSVVLGGPRRSSVVLGGTFHVTASNFRYVGVSETIFLGLREWITVEKTLDNIRRFVIVVVDTNAPANTAIFCNSSVRAGESWA